MTQQGLILWPHYQDLIQELFSTKDEGEFLRLVCRFFLDKFHVSEIKVYRMLDSGDALKILHLDSKGDILESERFQLEKGLGIVGHVAKTRRPYFSKAIEKDPLYISSLYSGVERSEMAFPLVFESNSIASIHLFQNMNSSSPDYSLDDLTLGLQIISEIQGAINSFVLFSKAKKLNDTLAKFLVRQDGDKNELDEEIKRNFERNVVGRPLIGQSDSVLGLKKIIPKISRTKEHLCVIGEKGVGKDFLVQAIHYQEFLEDLPLLMVNCQNLSEMTIELSKRFNVNEIDILKKIVMLAKGGNLYFRNIFDLSLEWQNKVFEVLNSYNCFLKDNMGIEKNNRIRIIFGMEKTPEDYIEQGVLRSSFFSSYDFYRVEIPNLKKRKEDLYLLANYFLRTMGLDEEVKGMTSEAIKLLSTYDWPGNIKELQQVLKKACLTSDNSVIDVSDFDLGREVVEQFQISDNWDEDDTTLDSVEKKHILQTLNYMKGNKTKASKALGITVKTLYNKLKYYGMI